MQYYEKMEVRDIHNDMPLAAACQTDVERWCSNIKSGAAVDSGCALARSTRQLMAKTKSQVHTVPIGHCATHTSYAVLQNASMWFGNASVLCTGSAMKATDVPPQAPDASTSACGRSGRS